MIQEFWKVIGPDHPQALFWIGIGVVSIIIMLVLSVFHISDEFNGNRSGTLERSEKSTVVNILTVIAIVLFLVQLIQ